MKPGRSAHAPEIREATNGGEQVCPHIFFPLFNYTEAFASAPPRSRNAAAARQCGATRRRCARSRRDRAARCSSTEAAPHAHADVRQSLLAVPLHIRF
jgi:hypothetical protein